MTLDDLHGKRVLITGASTGIGAAVARAFGAQGAHVGVHYNASADPARAVVHDIEAAGGRAHLLQADARDPEAMRGIVADFAEAAGGLDVLINNAGGTYGRTPIEEIDDAHYDSLVDLNQRSVFVASQAAVPHLRAAGGGTIINTVSIAARSGGSGGIAVYAGTKGFVVSFTRALAKELAGDRIRVNAVSPGTVDTHFHEVASTPQQLENAKGKIPMGRLGDPEDLTGSFLYLASETLSGYVTGQVIEVNGGALLR
ncbi:SDR family NAD(P)-dependent oxidoreductase [Rhodovibrio salinarum]|uniref:NAD(P)-dependent oxidoreductase n=1 Tax=Rhodovibrio salinarum TaxID=1087 RepID=A0A934QID7_9PROT|nr:SDR family NAD(P)-dependent oxidoreductase [Rhodovibrio salinarum]MBK1697551.1 NAD(P)-dependent oxidoreductase [Rhodovibrio salinarum]